MSLPDLIEIVPLTAPISAQVTVPGSKSITNRALILAALANGPVTLSGALWSEDTQAMFECLEKLGFQVSAEADPDEPANRTFKIQGLGGRIPRAGTPGQPLELFVSNAGTAARFLLAFVCLGKGTYRLSGVPRMHERPQGALIEALRQLGYRVDSPNNKLPAVVHGTGPRTARCEVSISESSQFASALQLSAPTGGWQVEIRDFNPDEAPYVTMTLELLKAFPWSGGDFEIEPDASGGSYFIGADYVQRVKFPQTTGRIAVNHWPKSGWQIDAEFPKFLPFPTEVSRERDLGDAIMTGITLASLHGKPVRFTELGRLRVQECERVAALRTELTKCGAQVEETGDTLVVQPSALYGAEIETYNDHRMAMCFATLGLIVPGLRLKNPACVKKTFPNFFQKLAAPAPHGLGVEIRDARTGRILGPDDLLAE
jgi:3-phosphoshikimate 1-carboxyvinyltransferase